jgi:lactoylglutathione lyase
MNHRAATRPLEPQDIALRQRAHALPVDAKRRSRDADDMKRPRIVGINHVALEVGDLEEALAFYGEIFDLVLRGREPGMAFVDMGDQFIAFSAGRTDPPDGARHFGLVVDDKEAVRAALQQAGVEIKPGRRLDFRDPWGNHVQVVDYRDVQFTKAPDVLRGMALDGLDKRPEALLELRQKGLA